MTTGHSKQVQGTGILRHAKKLVFWVAEGVGQGTCWQCQQGVLRNLFQRSASVVDALFFVFRKKDLSVVGRDLKLGATRVS